MAENNSNEQVEASAPNGWRIRIIGHDLIIILLFSFIVYMMWQISDKATIDHLGIVKELRINSYILSLPPELRPRLIPPQDIYFRTENYQQYKRQQEQNKQKDD